MKQFPYAQQIIWENDVEQIEWVDRQQLCWVSCTYVGHIEGGEVQTGVWKDYEGELYFCTKTTDYETCDVLCWAKL